MAEQRSSRAPSLRHSLACRACPRFSVVSDDPFEYDVPTRGRQSLTGARREAPS